MSTASLYDHSMMQAALDLAWQGRFSTSPNPRVGCVIAHGSQVVGQGFHVQAGHAHAEIHALSQAGSLAQGATAYVTLEPCSHTGRTGPCALALINAGIRRVVVAIKDPNPLVAGQGMAMLRAAGVEVDCGLMAEQARAQNRGFLSRIERQRPFIRLKIATSLDGKSALANGQSQWITGSEARTDVHIMRAESCAILTGIGTVLADNPSLNVRHIDTIRQPLRIVLDSHGRIPSHCQLMQEDGSPTLVVTTCAASERFDKYPPPSHVSILNIQSEAQGRIDLQALWPKLAKLGIGELMIEAGSTLSSACLQHDWVDEMVVYQAPKILGQPGQNAFNLAENPQALSHHDWHTQSIRLVGDDIKWVLSKSHPKP